MKDHHSIAQRFAASALSVMLARCIAIVAVFGLNAILARWLTPGDFGLFIFFFSLFGLLSLIACLGLNRAVVSKLAKENVSKAMAMRLVRHSLAITQLASIIVGATAGVASTYFVPDTVDVIYIGTLVAAIVILRATHLVLAEVARGFHERLMSNLFGGCAGGPLPHLVFVGLLLVGRPESLVSSLGLYCLAFLITLPIIWVRAFALAGSCDESIEANQAENPALESKLSDGLLAAGIPLMLTQTCGLAMSQADIWIAGMMAAPAAIALYATAQRLLALLTVPLQIAGTAIINFVPEMADSQKSELQHTVSLAAFTGGVPGIFLSVVFLCFAEQILGLVFGARYAVAANLLRILTAGQLVCLLTGPCEILLMMAGKQNTTLRVNVVAAIALAILGPCAVVGFGMQGLAVSIAFVTASQNLANCYLAHRLLGVVTHVGAVPWTTLNSIAHHRLFKQLDKTCTR